MSLRPSSSNDLPIRALQADRLILAVEPTTYKMDLWKALKAASDERLFLYFISANRSQEWGIDTSADPDIFVAPRNWFRAARLLLVLLGRRRYRSIMVPGWWQPLVRLVLVYALFARVPTLVETDTALNAFTPWWKRMVKRAIYPHLFRVPTHFLAFGECQRAYLQSYGVKSDRITVARATVNTSDLTRARGRNFTRRHKLRRQYGLRPDSVIFLSVGRLEPHKGISALLTSGVELLRSCADVELVVVGDGTMRHDVEEHAAASDRTHYLGRKDWADLVTIYSICDVLIHVPLIEPWGLVINEAMAAGLPLLVSNQVGCLVELVQDGKNAFVVDPLDIPAITTKARRLALDSGLRDRMSAASLEIIADWTIERYAANVMGAWRQVCR